VAKTGRGNKAIETVPAELRAQIDALLDVGTSPLEIYEQFPAVQAAMALRTLQEYATDRRRERQIAIALDAKAFLQGLLDTMEVERGSLTAIEQAMIGASLKEMLLADKAPTRLNGVLAVLNIRKDRRKTEEHGVRMRIAEAKAAIEKKATVDGATGQKVVSLEEVARLLEAVDMKDKDEG